MSKAFIEGRIAGRKCIPIRCNPYPTGSFAFAQWTYGWDRGKHTCGLNYGHDVGNLHVIDWITHECIKHMRAWPGFEPAHLRISPADWSRS